MVEVQLKVRFLFVLLGPKNDKIDYLEIGRCIGTLMTNKVRIYSNWSEMYNGSKSNQYIMENHYHYS